MPHLVEIIIYFQYINLSIIIDVLAALGSSLKIPKMYSAVTAVFLVLQEF